VTAYDVDFKAPAKLGGPQLSAVELKDKIREEQRAKAADADLRKKRRQETLTKKKEKGQQMAQVRWLPRGREACSSRRGGMPGSAAAGPCASPGPDSPPAAAALPPPQDRAKAAVEAAAKAAATPSPEPAAAERVLQRVSSSGADEAAAPVSSGPAPRNKHGVNVKALVPPAVVVPRAKSGKDSWEKKAQQIWKKNMAVITFALVMLLLLVIVFLMR
jgi:hypothetical protein